MKPIEVTGGTLNRIVFDPTIGVINKQFFLGNGINRPANDRIAAERWSMTTFPVTPRFIEQTDRSISMSYLEGERHLDQAITVYPEATTQDIFRQAGETLADIHKKVRFPTTDYFHRRYMQKTFFHLNRNVKGLTANNVDIINLIEFMVKGYNRQEVERRGLVWIHGDYWLNNLIGRRINGSFRLNGVIDWELAGLGSPYEDFATVLMSIEAPYPSSSRPFWKGYGREPDRSLQTHFAIAKTLEWMSYDQEAQTMNYSTPFYQGKIKMMKGVI